MLAEIGVVLKSFDNHIEYICTDAEIRLHERNQIFTVIREDPYTILKPYKSALDHKSPEIFSDTFSFFWYIKDNDTPASIPSAFLYTCHT